MPGRWQGRIIRAMTNAVSFVLAHPRFLAFGAATAFLSSFGQTFFISLFGGELRSAFGLGHGDFGAIYAVGTLASAAVLIWAGRKIDELDLRLYTAVVGFGLAAACVVMAATRNVAWLVLAVFLLRFFGQGLMSHTSASSMARYFEADRGKALSIAGMGYPLGEAAYPVMVVLVVAALGWRGAWLVCAAFMVVVTIPVVGWLLKGHGERHRRHIAALAKDRQHGRHAVGWTRLQVIGDRRFYLLLPAFLAPSFIGTALFFHQIRLVDEKGWDLTVFVATYTAYAVAQAGAVFATGWLVDRFRATALMRIYLLPYAAACLVLVLGSHPAIIPVYMVLFGIGSGVVAVIHGAFWAELYGVAHIGAIKAMGTALMVLGSAGGPVLMGVLIDAGWPVSVQALGCAVLFVAASALIAAIPVLSPGPVSRPPPETPVTTTPA